MPWQPINTAPKDDVILVAYPPLKHLLDQRRVFEAKWDDVLQTWISAQGYVVHCEVTQWQPLPAAPE